MRVDKRKGSGGSGFPRSPKSTVNSSEDVDSAQKDRPLLPQCRPPQTAGLANAIRENAGFGQITTEQAAQEASGRLPR